MNPVYRSFLENTFAEAGELAGKSDVLRLMPIPPFPPCGYLCEFDVSALRLLPDKTVKKSAETVSVGILFPEDYLRSTDPLLYLKVAMVMEPRDLLHPNVCGGTVCLGAAFAPGTPLTALLWELYEIFSYQNYTLDERNALNPIACRLFRANPGLLDDLRPAPFLRRRHQVQIKMKTP